MTYHVYAFLDGHWTLMLATTSLDHAKAFRREIRGVRTMIEESKND